MTIDSPAAFVIEQLMPLAGILLGALATVVALRAWMRLHLGTRKFLVSLFILDSLWLTAGYWLQAAHNVTDDASFQLLFMRPANVALLAIILSFTLIERRK